MKTEFPKVPKPSGADAALALVRAGVGSIPIAGAAATELVNWLIKSPIERRRDEWMRQVGEVLENLTTGRGETLESLQNNEAFVDVVLQATQIALRNHHEKKREALRNAITNSVGPKAPAEAKSQMFLQFIDRFSVLHLRMLEVVSDPNGWFQRLGRSLPDIQQGSAAYAIELAFPELSNEINLRDAVWNDLQQTGLASKEPPPGIIGVSTVPQNWANSQGTPGIGPVRRTSPFAKQHTTKLGDEFLSFIKSPTNS